MIDPIEAVNPTAEQSERTQLLTKVLAELQLTGEALKAKKKGPSTPEAIDRVKYNARRHGLTGQVLLLTLEERPLYDLSLIHISHRGAKLGVEDLKVISAGSHLHRGVVAAICGIQ